MPHSSGGGSHFSSSSVSHASSRSSSGNSSSYVAPPPPRREHRPFPGCRRYVYYRNAVPYYIYSDHDLVKESKQTKRSTLIALIITIVIFSLMFIGFGGVTKTTKKIKGFEEYPVEVIDAAEVLGDTKKLEKTLEEFKELTGVVPSIITLNNEDWMPYYESMEDTAYDVYVGLYEDEGHWVILYTEPEEVNPSFNDWHWWGMQGYDTDPVLTYGVTEKFDDSLQDKLLKSNKYTVTEAIDETFKETIAELNRVKANWPGITVLIIGALLVAIEYYAYLGFKQKEGYRDSELEEVDPNDIMETCDSCGFEYFKGNFTRCPKCGKEIVKE